MSQRKAMREDRRLAAMASWRDRRRKLTEFRKSTRSRLFGLLRGKCGIKERVRHRAALVLTDRQVAEQREKLRDDYRRKVGDARRHWSWQGWVEWLREQAARGDAEAIASLEARGEKIPERINGIESSGKRPVAANRIADWDCAVVDGERKAVYSRVGVKGRVIDQGKRLELGETWSEASVEVALKLAAVKFGRRLIRLTGSDEYRMAVLRVEKRKRTGVRFHDEARLERLLEREQGRENDGR